MSQTKTDNAQLFNKTFTVDLNSCESVEEIVSFGSTFYALIELGMERCEHIDLVSKRFVGRHAY